MDDGQLSVDRRDLVGGGNVMRIDAPSGMLGHHKRGGNKPAANQRTRADAALGPNVLSLPERPRNAERELANANAILAAHPDSLLVIGANLSILRCNEAAEALLGDNPASQALPSVLNHPGILAGVAAVLAGDGPTLIDFTLPSRPDRHFRARVAPIENYAEGRTALIAISDFSEAKHAERMRADFVANASHELRTPLAILLGFIETLTGSAADDPEAQRRFLPIMQQQASRMARLVDDLLALSRIELTEHAPPLSQVQMPRLLAVVSQALKLRAAERGMQIELDVAGEIPEVPGDADELAQVFQNLIDNAIKYAARDTTIVVSIRPSTRLKHGIAVSVRDRGDGIAEAHLARLTERFYRVDTARSRAVGGTGLGLAIVKHIVSRHRGLLDIESKVGVGSRFTVHLGGSQRRQDTKGRLPVKPAGHSRHGSVLGENLTEPRADQSPQE
jgi:two-component system phosphate regulon sensor histidine kinase PhoR